MSQTQRDLSSLYWLILVSYSILRELKRSIIAEKPRKGPTAGVLRTAIRPALVGGRKQSFQLCVKRVNFLVFYMRGVCPLDFRVSVTVRLQLAPPE